MPGPEVWDSILEGRVSTALERFQGTRIWKVTAPILLQGNVVGAIQVRSSLETADRLAARERRQSLSLMTAASVFIVAGLGWYLQHHVSQPIQTLVQTMAQAEAGDLGAAARSLAVMSSGVSPPASTACCVKFSRAMKTK